MKLYKTLDRINKVAFILTLILYVTIIYGMITQILLGITQLTIAVILLFKKDDLTEEINKYMNYYWGLVFGFFIFIGLLYYNIFPDIARLLIFIIPICIAGYFVFITNKILKSFEE